MLISRNKHKVSGFGCQVSENRRQMTEGRELKTESHYFYRLQARIADTRNLTPYEINASL
jgi:hypothetical protein